MGEWNDFSWLVTSNSAIMSIICILWMSFNLHQGVCKELQIPHIIHSPHSIPVTWVGGRVCSKSTICHIPWTSWQNLYSFQDDMFLLEEAQDGSCRSCQSQLQEVAGRKKQAAQHICSRSSERKPNEDEPKERFSLLSYHTRGLLI